MSNHPSLQSSQTTATMDSNTPVVDDDVLFDDATTTHDPTYVHFLAQNLNNQACRWIAMGNFDAAIADLKHALHLARVGLLEDNKEVRMPSGCNHCSLKSYIMTANDTDDEDDDCEGDDCEGEDDDDDDDGITVQPEAPSHPKTLKRKRSSSTNIIDMDNCEASVDHCNNDNDYNKDELHRYNEHKMHFTQDSSPIENEGFIFSRPLRVRTHSIGKCHSVGTTLSFVVLFNIALAHHLKAIEMIPSMVDSKDRMEALKQPMKLYELAYQLHFQCKETKQSPPAPQQSSSHTSCDDTSTGNDHNLVDLRLMLLVTNNISQIHRLAGNEIKHNQCLEHLLNAVMYMNHICQNEKILSPREKDGTFDNLAPILKTKVYAAAA